MNKRILFLEAAGVVFVGACCIFMLNLYELCGKELTGILFGAVNGSMWEMCKTLLLPCLVWGLLEILICRVSVHRFAAAKTIALYALGALYLLLRLSGMSHFVAAAVSVSVAQALSFLLYSSPLPLRGLFAPSLVFLFLLVALYFSLTPFPPKHEIFRDPATGMYGLIPKYLDYGAIALDTLYFR